MIPDFLKADYNNYLNTANQFQRFHKFIHLNFIYFKYVSIILYAASKETNLKMVKIDKFIFNRFLRPTEGVWLNFVKELISSGLVKDLCHPLSTQIDKDLSIKFENIYNNFVDYSHEPLDALDALTYYQRVVSIKNRLISHGLTSEDTASKILKAMEPIFHEIVSNLKVITGTPLVLIQDNHSEIFRSCIVPADSKQVDPIVFEEINDNGLYLIINNTPVLSMPFLECRDGNVLIYDKYDRKNSKVFYSGPIEKEFYIRTSASDIAELFMIDKESIFLKALSVDLKVSETGVYHNLPSKDYNEFVGRIDELRKLETMLKHKRHFISALDGIGGVGKSAIALEFCYEIVNSNPKDSIYFENVIWLSAKNTIFVDGEIRFLDQAFEHLEQLIDTILEVINFSEFKNNDLQSKTQLVLEIISETSVLIVLDNLETLQKENLNDVWKFINDLPSPSKVLLTSREYHYNVPQTLRIESLSLEDSREFIFNYGKEIGLEVDLLRNNHDLVTQISSGLPIAIKSILGQLYLGKPLKSIKKDIESNKGDLSKFCFEQQLIMLKKEHMEVLLIVCLSTDSLDYETLFYIMPANQRGDLLMLINELSSLSIINISHEYEKDYYSILNIIKSYILGIYNNEEHIAEVKNRLNEYYQLKDVDSYVLLPIEERSIDKGSLIPMKLVDKAMKHSNVGEVEQAEQEFKKALKDYSDESYVWYMYAMYLAQYPAKISEAINCLRKADELAPNYLYNKKIGDYHLKLKNYQAAIRNYNLAMQKSSLEKNKNEMLYCIANAEFSKVKHLRRTLKHQWSTEKLIERNKAYSNVVNNLEKYIQTQPNIYDGKLIRIYRLLSESYFGLKDKGKALEYIEKAIDLSEGDEFHIDYKLYIQK